jgi:HEAT repeat protein
VGAEVDATDTTRAVILMEWRALGARGGLLVGPLLHVLRSDSSLLTIEVAAIALALQGEEGASEIVHMLQSADFVMRHKAAVALGVLDGAARWAVPSLLTALQREGEPLVVINLVNALGRIGGTRAQQAIQILYARERAAAQPDTSMLEALESALVSACLHG